MGRTKGELNSTLHTVCNGEDKPILRLLSSGQVNDYKEAEQFVSTLPKAKDLLVDRGDDLVNA